MRKRVSGPEVRYTISPVYTKAGTSSWVLYRYFPWSNVESSEVILDDPKRRRVLCHLGQSVQAYKAVNHTRYSTDCTGGDVEWRVGTNTYARSNATCIYLYEAGFSDQFLYGGVWNDVPLSSPLAKFYDHWQKCKPSLATRANLAVFLYELRDIKRMFEILPWRHFSSRNWRDVLRYANGQHLNFNFGWKPFLNDVVNVFEGLTSLDTRLARFLREENTLLMRRWKEDYSVDKITSQSWSIYRAEATTNLQVRASSAFTYSYDAPDYGQRELRARAMLDTLGLKATMANAWAILPWSFVVDWFFDVGGYLDQFSSDWLQPWVDLIQGCHSYRVEGTVKHVLYNVTYGGSAPIGTLTLKHYHRTPGVPAFSATTDPLSADKIRLLASLAGSLIL